MKNTIPILVVIAFMAGVVFSGCRFSTEKTENAKDKVQEAKGKVVEMHQELNQALKDSIHQFMRESEEKIIAYENSIAEIKASLAKLKEEDKAKYEKKLAELEQKSSDMKKKLEDYMEEEIDKWKSFQSEFKKDLDELGKALKNFTVDSN